MCLKYIIPVIILKIGGVSRLRTLVVAVIFIF